VALLIFMTFATSYLSAATQQSLSARKTDLTSDFILFDRDEIHLFVKMHLPQSRFFDHPVIQFSLDLHHEKKHVIV